MMLASAVLGKSMLGGGLLSHFHPADMPFRSIPAKLLVGTLSGRRSEQHEAQSDLFSQKATTGAPSWGVSALMVAIAPEVVLALGVQVSFCWMR